MAREIRMIEDFKDLVSQNALYVDKSNFIKEVLSKDVVLYTRPRRFGKTLNMHMLYYFFSNQEDSYELFKDLNIAKDAESMKHLNQYPVIFLSLKVLTRKNFSLQMSDFSKTIIYNLYDKHRYLLNSDNLEKEEKKLFDRYLENNADESELASALYNLSRMMYKHFKKKSIILVDEYDVPLKHAQQYGYYDDMLDFIRSLFSGTFKTNEYLYKGVMTGCLRIARESVFTGLNNFRNDSILTNNPEVYFGFTEDEVKDILAEYNMQDKFSHIKDWYDGYLFGNKEVYNPWSMLNYIDEARKDLVSEPVSYWVNTSGNEIIYDFLKRSDSELKDNFTKLVNGEAIKADIYPEMTYRELEDDEMVYSYLLTTGYLKALGKNEDGTYNLVIPNKEVRTVYEKYFSKYTKGLKKKYSLKICRSLFDGDGEKAEELINDYLFESVSSVDYSEAFYHGTLNSMFDGFASLSNREFGYGRPDIVVLDNSVTVLIEIKKTKDLLLLSKAADEAIEQIKEKKYIEGLNSYGYKNIRAYGVSFCKKRCCVKMLNQ